MRGARVNSLVYAVREGLTEKVPALSETRMPGQQPSTRREWKGPGGG